MAAYLKSAARYYQTAHDSAAAFDQDEERVAEYTKGLQLISEGSEKTAAGIESSSSSTSSNGADMVAEGLEILTTCLKEYQATIEEIREIENSLWD